MKVDFQSFIPEGFKFFIHLRSLNHFSETGLRWKSFFLVHLVVTAVALWGGGGGRLLQLMNALPISGGSTCILCLVS